jgi:hypothetical protein
MSAGVLLGAPTPAQAKLHFLDAPRAVRDHSARSFSENRFLPFGIML